MRKLSLKSFFAGLLGIALITGAQSSSSVPGPLPTSTPGDVGTYIDGAAAAQMQTLNIQGMAVAVILPGQAPIIKAYGVGSDPKGDPASIDPDRSIMPLASISKTFVAVAMMRAVEKGKLSLDAPANRYLDFKLPTFKGSREITVRDIARHEAGFEERWLATGAGGEKPDPRPWGKILEQTAPQLIAPPGAYSSYSNYGAALLGYIVERATGVSYDEYLQSEVLNPLDMASTTIEDPVPLAFASRSLQGWSINGGIMSADKHFYNKRTYPAGRVQSSLPDMVKYMQMLLSGGVAADGKRFLTAKSVDVLLVPSKRFDPEMPAMATLFAEKDIGGMRFIGHGGDGGTHHTDMLLQPKQGVGIFLLYLAAPGAQTRDQFSRALVASLFPGSRPQLLARPDGSAAKRDYSALTGAYRHYRWAQTSIERILQLSSEFAVADTGQGTLVVSGRLGAGEYVPTAKQNLFKNRITGEALLFRTDGTGRTLLNHGSYPFVTAYKLDMVDTQSFNSSAYWTFVAGLTGIGLAALALAVSYLRGGDTRRSAAGFALFGSAMTGSGIALYKFLSAASAISEAELQHAIPDAAYYYLAVPVISAVLISVFVAGWIKGDFRPRRVWPNLLAVFGVALFGAFVAFLIHWHAFGWWFPKAGALS